MESLFKQDTFITPSGYKWTIKEQNGEAEDILSNKAASKGLKNILNFIAYITVSQDFVNKVVTGDDLEELPLLDKYCIMLKSRILSLGEEVEFDYHWNRLDGEKEALPVTYSVELTEYLFNDYSKEPGEEELQNKNKFAVPYYPNGNKSKDIKFTTTSGKEVYFDLLTSKGENYLITLPESEQSKNKTLVARNLRMMVKGELNKVENFQMFSTRDMFEIRKFVNSCDPEFTGLCEINHPSDGRSTYINLLGLDSFFYMGGY